MAHLNMGLKRPLSVFAEFHASSLNRPHFSYYWTDHDRVGLSLDWGNGSSDPVFNVTLELRVPHWIERYLP